MSDLISTSQSPSPGWDPALYLRFAGERTRAAIDLLARIPVSAPQRVLDIGCGPGNSTALLAARFPGADLTGLDSSPEMLAAAHESGVPARWIAADMDTWSPQPGAAPDLIFANAALQWSRNPTACAARLFSLLAPQGWLAVQVPRNFAAPSHTLVRDIAALPQFADAFAGVRGYDPGQSATPADWARALGLPQVLNIWVTTYVHLLEGPDPILRFMSGTGLRPYLERLEGERRDAFTAAIAQAFRDAYPPETDGRTLFPFERLFVVARRN
jgi:trans-aconitate 2-methyltransferase